MLPNILSVLRSAAFPAATPQPRREPTPAPAVRRLEPLPERRVDGRRKFHDMLWFPVLRVQDDLKLVVSAKAGLPHCLKCETPLTLESLPKEQWRCALCGDARPGSEADFFVADSVVMQEMQEFFAANPEYRAAPGLSAPKNLLPAEMA